jgi:hypothetical protein
MVNKMICAALLASLLMMGLASCGSGDIQVQTSGTAGSEAWLVSLSITPTDPSIANNTGQRFTATGIYSDSTTRDLTASVTWSSSDTTVATIGTEATTGSSFEASASTNNGLGHAYAYGKAVGKTTIKASLGSISDATNLTVSDATLVAVEITPSNPTIAKGTAQQFTATGTFSDNTTQDLTAFATWSSSDTGVATVNVAGMAIPVAAGQTTITAASGSVSGSTALTVTPATLVSITVTPANPSIAKGTTRQFSATGTYSDYTTQDLTASVAWSSSDTGVAAISASGLATSLAAGQTTISATAGSVSGSTALTVTPATLVSIAVTPVNPSIAKGTKQQFTATGTYSDNSTQNLTATVTWSSSNTGIATVSNAAGSNGLATSVATGTTTISATSGSESGSTTLTVTAATLVSIAVTPVNASIAAGTSQQFTATGTYSDNSTQNLTALVTWSSSNTGAETISNATGSKGLATAIASGTATITAVSGGISRSTTLTVTAPAAMGSATLTWSAPTTNTDGTPLTDLAGYKIHYGTSAGSYTKTIDVGNVTTYTVNNLTSGTYYFAVTAYDTSGNESSYSNEAYKTIP